MAPRHTMRLAGASRLDSTTSKALGKRRQQILHKPAQRPTRLNKVHLSGINIATSKALSLQAKDARIRKKRSRPPPKIGKSLSKLGNLADALPTVTENQSEGTIVKNLKSVPAARSLKPRPGMQKRRAALEKIERERFGLNLAILASAKAIDNDGEGMATDKDRIDTQNAIKWAALRKHIADNLNGI